MKHVNNKFIRTLYGSVKHVTDYSHFAILKIAVNEEDLRRRYENLAAKHNRDTLTKALCDSGFDIIFPKHTIFHGQDSNTVDFEIHAEMLHCETSSDTITISPFFLIPRSGISKYPLMVSNHVGVINSHYKGSIKGAFRNFFSCSVEKDTSLLQICHPSLCPIITVISNTDELTNVSPMSPQKIMYKYPLDMTQCSMD